MDIEESLFLDLKACQHVIYEGFKSTLTSGLSWLEVKTFYN